MPHVLRCEGVLRYTAELERRIDAGEIIAAGSPEEVEIRASAVHAVEGCAAAASRAGRRVSARHLDWLLWNRGQQAEIKARLDGWRGEGAEEEADEDCGCEE